MKRYFFNRKYNFTHIVLLSLFIALPQMAARDAQQSPVLTSLEHASKWIKDNISFPTEAYNYSYVGVESFVISADREGRVYITSHLTTLNPAFEQEIKGVVGRCPKCRLAGIEPEDMYQKIEVDFAEYIPEKDKAKFTDVSAYSSPLFIPSDSRVDARKDSRDVLWSSVSTKLRLTEKETEACSSSCTLSVRYTISEDAVAKDIEITGTEDRKLCEAIERSMKKMRGWRPAKTTSMLTIRVEICDRIVLSPDDKGNVTLERYKEDVLLGFQAISDKDAIVINPGIPAWPVRNTDIAQKSSEYEYVDGFTGYNSYPGFLSDGKKSGIKYDDRRTKAYMDIVNAYPSFGADAYSYGKFRYMSHNDYIEALIIKGQTPHRKVRIKKVKSSSAQTNTICTFENNRIIVNEDFIENTFFDLTKANKKCEVSTYDTTYCYHNNQTLEIETGLNLFEPKDGYNEIKISNSTKTLLHIGNDDMWTYTFKGRSTTDYSKYTSDRYYIPLMSDDKVTLIAFIGWPYGGDLPLLTIVAITGTEAKVVYNRYVSIDTISKSPNLEIKLETVLVEYGEGGVPFNEQKYHWIKYRDSKLIYE